MAKAKLGSWLVCAVLLCVMAEITGMRAFAEGEAVAISLEQGSLQLYPPFEVESALMAKDGGTISVVVQDSRKNLLPLCSDARIGVPVENRYAYVQATYPTDPTAQRVTVGSALAESILRVLKSAKIDKTNPRAREDIVQMMIQKLEGANVPGQVLQISGKWDTNFDTLILAQDGNKVSGTYTHDEGKIEGVLEGDILRGQWLESPSYKPPDDAGDLEWIFAQDVKTFNGKWRYGFGGQSWSGDWTGKKE